MNENSTQIQQKLLELLEQDNPDLTAIQDLVTDLSLNDKTSAAFTVDAGLIERLGRELVGRNETALSEIIKNAYDADAPKVKVVFHDAHTNKGKINIYDSGNGMSHSQFLQGFMRISSSDKINNPTSPRFHRRRAGRKGIGRFAIQRLGSRVTILTKVKGDDLALKVSLNWNDYKPDQNLTSLRHNIEKVSWKKEMGTKISIEGIEGIWTLAKIKTIYRYVLDLIQPTPLSQAAKDYVEEQNDIDPGFVVEFVQMVNGERVNVISEESEIFNHAVAKIEAFVDEKGVGQCTVTSDALGHSDTFSIMPRDEDSTTYTSLKNAYLKAHYFIYNSEFIPRQLLGTFRETAKNRSGIKLYRNGFRVLPYGEFRDDWLTLDHSATARTILPPHSNSNFYGFVEVTDEEGNMFEETASREGVIENDAYIQLVEFGFASLSQSVLKIASFRNRKQKAGSTKSTPTTKFEPSKSSTALLDEALRNIANIKDKGEADTDPLMDTLLQAKEQVRRDLAELAMLRILSSLGLFIGEFNHEIKHHLVSLLAENALIAGNLDDKNNLVKRIGLHNKVLKSLMSYSGYFDKAIAQNVNREVRPQNLFRTIVAFEEVIRQSANRAGIELIVEQDGHSPVYTIPMHPSELSSILVNLFTNSKKAVQNIDVPAQIRIFVAQNNGKCSFEFSDNGVGIPNKYRDRIFDAFFTTTGLAYQAEIGDLDNVGSGLGLKIVSDILSSNRGTISLVEPGDGFATCFRIEMPISSIEEVKQYYE